MSDNQLKTIEQYFQLISQPAQTAAINTALRLGLVEGLTDGQKTVSELAELCKINADGCLALVNLLIQSGMVEQYDEYLALTQAGRLTSQSMWGVMFDQWTHLENSLRIDSDDDEPEFERQRLQEKRLQQYRVIHAQSQWSASGAALKTAEALGIGTERTGLRILNLACGSAIYSMTIAHRDPTSTVTLVDDSLGLGLSCATVESLEIGDRVSMIESDELVVDGNNDSYDLVLLADNVHSLGQEVLQRVLHTAKRTLVDGGEIAMIDVFPGQERGDQNRSLFQLQLLTGTGRAAMTLEDLKQMLDTSGFRGIQFANLPVAPFTHGLVLAHLPQANNDAVSDS